MTPDEMDAAYGRLWMDQIATSSWFHEGLRLMRELETRLYLRSTDFVWLLLPDCLTPSPPTRSGSTLCGVPVHFSEGAEPHLMIRLAKGSTP